jgi:hypothetical protein
MTTDPKAIADAAAREGHRLYSEAQLKLSECEDHLAAIIQRHIEPLVSVPGAWVCPKCGFTCFKNILCANTGNVGADTSSHFEICPNDMERMQRLTWHDHCKGLADRAEKEIIENNSLRAERDQLKKENTALRAIVVKHECPYGHRLPDGVCKLGYPGCACADDAACHEDETVRCIIQEHNQLKAQLEQERRNADDARNRP